VLYSVDFIVYLCGKFALHEELILYTFMVILLYVRNLFVQTFRAKRLINLALFSYPYTRNSYMHFVLLYTIQLSICEELLCAFWHYSVIHMRRTLMCILYCSALFNYPYVRNSYVSFWHYSIIHIRGIIMCILLSLTFDNQTHVLYIAGNYECLA